MVILIKKDQKILNTLNLFLMAFRASKNLFVPPIIFLLIVSGALSVAVYLSFCVGGLICGIWVVFIFSTSIFLSVAREG